MSGTTTKRALGFALAIGVVALLASAYFAPSFYEVVDKGPYVRPYSPDPGSVYEVRLFDAVTVYGDRESRPRPDEATATALVALAVAALMTALILRATGAPRRLRLFYAIAAGGAGFLAVDEMVAIHETLGHNLPFLADLPGVDHPDDPIVALYALPALAFVIAFRDILAASAPSCALFGAGMVFFAFAAAADLIAAPAEELFEVLASACLFAGFVVLIVLHLGERLRPLTVGQR
jgi:hypothetical protein